MGTYLVVDMNLFCVCTRHGVTFLCVSHEASRNHSQVNVCETEMFRLLNDLGNDRKTRSWHFLFSHLASLPFCQQKQGKTKQINKQAVAMYLRNLSYANFDVPLCCFPQDLSPPVKLLAASNIDQSKLLEYVTDVVKYATKGTLKNLELKIVGNNRPDIAAFDFTSIKKAEHAARIIERKGSKLLVGLVGDSLLEVSIN